MAADTRNSDGDEPWFGAREALVARLIAETAQSRDACEAVVRELEALDTSLRPALQRWWSAQEIDDTLVVHGYSVRRLLAEKRSATVTGAFLWLGRLVRQPEKAIPILAMADEWLDLCGWAGDH